MFNEYLKLYLQHEKEFPNQLQLPLMQVGSFYEAYATDELGPPLKQISQLLNVICTKKNKNIPNK